MCEDDARQLQRPRASSEQDSARNTQRLFSVKRVCGFFSGWIRLTPHTLRCDRGVSRVQTESPAHSESAGSLHAG